jgi:hypothetical protein
VHTYFRLQEVHYNRSYTEVSNTYEYLSTSLILMYIRWKIISRFPTSFSKTVVFTVIHDCLWSACITYTYIQFPNTELSKCHSNMDFVWPQWILSMSNRGMQYRPGLTVEVSSYGTPTALWDVSYTRTASTVVVPVCTPLQTDYPSCIFRFLHVREASPAPAQHIHGSAAQSFMHAKTS